MGFFSQRKWIAVVALALPVACGSVVAEEHTEYVELEQRYLRYSQDFYIESDFSVDTTTTMEIELLTRKAVEGAKSTRFSWSTSIEEFEVLEAYTLKSDGSRLDVPRDNFQVTINRGNNEGGPVFSDRSSITVVFPDLEVHDHVVVKTKRMESEPMFPGHFTIDEVFWSQIAHDNATVSIDMPAGLEYQLQVRGMEQRLTEKGDREIIELAYSNSRPVQSQRQDYSVWRSEDEVGVSLSTFKDYRAVAEAYGERALPKAVPTKRVERLASEIIGEESDKRVRARMLYDWVATNISYAGNCIGVGAVVPHDTDFILDNRMGDCKDHATLLQSLYTAVDIPSTQALINVGSIYELPTVPMVRSVNHVINYIPEWDQFIDATNADMPFDLPGYALADKPVLLVEGYREGLRVPKSRPEQSRQIMVSHLTVNADGSVSGTAEVALQGYGAATYRGFWRKVSPDVEKRWLEQLFSSETQLGSGTVTKQDPAPLRSDFSYSFEFEKPDYVGTRGAGGLQIAPLVGTPGAVAEYVGTYPEEIHGYDVACGNGESSEQYTIEFPENYKLLAVPEGMELEENSISYRSSYRLDGNTLEVSRELRDMTPGNTCSGDLMNAQRPTVARIIEDLKSQVVFQIL